MAVTRGRLGYLSDGGLEDVVLRVEADGVLLLERVGELAVSGDEQVVHAQSRLLREEVLASLHEGAAPAPDAALLENGLGRELRLDRGERGEVPLAGLLHRREFALLLLLVEAGLRIYAREVEAFRVHAFPY